MWESVYARMPELLKELKCSDLFWRDKRGYLPQKISGPGIYVFYEHYEHTDKAIYVGRTNDMRKRLQQHARPKAGHNSAALAFRIAYRRSGPQTSAGGSKITRAELQRIPEFEKNFRTAKIEVRGMGMRAVRIKDPIEQAVFEVYAAVHLGTTVQHGGYNDFKNH